MRRKVVRIAPEILAEMLKPSGDQFKYYLVLKGVPQTAKLLYSGFYQDAVTPGYFYLTFEDDSFEEIKEGVVSEPLEIKIQTIASMNAL